MFGYATNFAVQSEKLRVLGPGEQSVSRELKLNDTSLIDLNNHVVSEELLEVTPTTLLRDQEYVAVVVTLDDSEKHGFLPEHTRIYVDGSRLFTARSAQRTFMMVTTEDVKNQLELARTDAWSAEIQVEHARQDIEKFEAALLQFQDAILDSIQDGPTLLAPPSLLSVPTFLDRPEVNF